MKHWGDLVSGGSTVIASLLSCSICPVCLPIYAGFLSIAGIELADIHDYLLPVMMGFGLITLGFMAYQIYTHQGKWTPLTFAMGASIGMAISAWLDYDYLLYTCLALFMGSVIWNKKTLIHQGHGCC